jgi:hypothetical protein
VFAVAQNATPTGARSATFEFVRTDVSPNKVVKRLTVVQDIDRPSNLAIQAEDRVLDFPAAGGTLQSRVTAADRRSLIYQFSNILVTGRDWPQGTNDPQVVVSADPLSPAANVAVTVPPNYSGYARGRRIQLLSLSGASFEIVVLQRASIPTGSPNAIDSVLVSRDAQFTSLSVASAQTSCWFFANGFAAPIPAFGTPRTRCGDFTESVFVPFNPGTAAREGFAWLLAAGSVNAYDYTVVHQSATPTSGPRPSVPISLADVLVVQRLNTLSNSTEFGCLTVSSGFTSWCFRTPTGLHVTGPSWVHLAADWDKDGLPDLVLVNRSGTASGNVELHVLSGRSGFTQFIAHVATPLPQVGTNVDVSLADVDRDGRLDLALILKSGTGSGRTEVHVLSAVSGFQHFILQVATMFGPTDGDWTLELRDGDGDNYPDLWAIRHRNSPSGRVEVQIAYGFTNFDRLLYGNTTPIAANNPAMVFTLGNVNGDRFWDIYAINTADASGQTRVQVLDGAAGFANVVVDRLTALPNVGSDWAFLSSYR